MSHKIQLQLIELPDVRPEERTHRDHTPAVRTTFLTHQNIPASGKEDKSVDPGMRNPLSYKPSLQTASPSHVSVRSRSRELCLQEEDSSKAPNHLDSEQQGKPFIIQEAPVRDDKQTDWSITSSDSDTGFNFPRLSYSDRKVEPVKPFCVSAASASGMGEFGSLTPDLSDLTVYNEIAKKTPHVETLVPTKRSTHREPTPGSECEKQQGACSRPLFSELRLHQQDSGFDSPFYQQK